jgi:hypothetical protein
MTVASTIAPVHSQSTPEIFEGDEHPTSESQCMRALARANEVRLARAALKRQVASGEREVTDVVADLPWEAHSMALAELLCSQRRWGRARSRKLLNSVGLSEGKRLGSLTERQQRILVRALEVKGREQRVPMPAVAAT